MGEIKSTLDLVMERTRHLSLSEEEKQQQQHLQFEKRLAGLMQQVADQKLTGESIWERIGQLEQELKIADKKLIYNEIISRINPDRDNQIWLQLIVRLKPSAGQALEEQLIAYQRQKTDILQTARKRQQEQLAQTHGIMGTAVAANPHKDPACRKALADLRKKTQDSLLAVSRRA